MSADTPADKTLEILAKVIKEQNAKYGPFPADISGMRLAVACLEDEVAEVLQAWREERRTHQRDDGLRGTWQETAEEALQVAAVAMRLVFAATGVVEEARDE